MRAGLELACPDWLNLSIATNIFPDKWKIGQVKQLHKSGQQRERNNCRPIPVRQILSKILEKHVANLWRFREGIESLYQEEVFFPTL